MMRLPQHGRRATLRRATLLVAFSVLALAATAYAECAWVVWMGSDLIRAFPTYEACLRELPHETPGDPKSPVINPWLWRCLPDTVDPRGPKGSR